MEPLYRIEEQSTVGWVDWDENQPPMTKEKCKALFDEIINDGISPEDIRIKRVS
tara:strand:+ start:19 stop:180 length:162 start_codon:yes stop_codon:yes gene_type:complete